MSLAVLFTPLETPRPSSPKPQHPPPLLLFPKHLMSLLRSIVRSSGQPSMGSWTVAGPSSRQAVVCSLSPARAFFSSTTASLRLLSFVGCRVLTVLLPSCFPAPPLSLLRTPYLLLLDTTVRVDL